MWVNVTTLWIVYLFREKIVYTSAISWVWHSENLVYFYLFFAINKRVGYKCWFGSRITAAEVCKVSHFNKVSGRGSKLKIRIPSKWQVGNNWTSRFWWKCCCQHFYFEISYMVKYTLFRSFIGGICWEMLFDSMLCI